MITISRSPSDRSEPGPEGMPTCCRQSRYPEATKYRQCTEPNTADALNKCSFVVLHGAEIFLCALPQNTYTPQKLGPNFY